MSWVTPRSTAGVVEANCQTLRPLDGRSMTARASTVCDTAARSVWIVVFGRFDGDRLVQVADAQDRILADDLIAGDRRCWSP